MAWCEADNGVIAHQIDEATLARTSINAAMNGMVGCGEKAL